jgi:hypothetical protein
VSDGARAVGDGKSGGRGDGVGRVSVGQRGGSWAVCGVLADNIGDIDGAVGVGRGASHKGGSSSGDGETHVDGIKRVLVVVVERRVMYLFDLRKANVIGEDRKEVDVNE